MPFTEFSPKIPRQVHVLLQEIKATLRYLSGKCILAFIQGKQKKGGVCYIGDWQGSIQHIPNTILWLISMFCHINHY
jgi:hypothetical protein